MSHVLQTSSHAEHMHAASPGALHRKTAAQAENDVQRLSPAHAIYNYVVAITGSPLGKVTTFLCHCHESVHASASSQSSIFHLPLEGLAGLLQVVKSLHSGLLEDPLRLLLCLAQALLQALGAGIALTPLFLSLPLRGVCVVYSQRVCRAHLDQAPSIVGDRSQAVQTRKMGWTQRGRGQHVRHLRLPLIEEHSSGQGSGWTDHEQ
mmetsp:Transcript_30604/g.62988  ORF Transcript_30604/g.62988 Transcript_30604/m.62988 type:complete len:206 (-) Transcript_30604:1322-1939(-)